MARILRNLKINEVSGVDVGAGRGVRIMLMKRDDEGAIDFSAAKREFSSAERESAASSGAALPDGSFPIKSKQDLKNAIQAIGRAKNPAKAKAHIKSRARSLGASDLIPDTWKRDSDAETNALRALNAAIESILTDDDVTDKIDKVDESIAQFNEFMQETDEMTPEEISALIAKAVDPLKAEIAKRDEELAIYKMSDKHKAFHDGLTGDAKKAFAAMTPSQRDDEMEKEARKGKRKPSAAEEAAEGETDKRFVEIEKRNSELEKMLGAMIAKERSVEFRKRAAEAGLREDDGEVMRKAFDGDPEAQAALTKRFSETTNALKAQVKTNVLFAEFGKSGPDGAGASAYQAIEMKAAELRKSDPKLTQAQAFSKAYIDPANAELVEQHKREETQRRAAYTAAGGF